MDKEERGGGRSGEEAKSVCEIGPRKGGAAEGGWADGPGARGAASGSASGGGAEPAGLRGTSKRQGPRLTQPRVSPAIRQLDGHADHDFSLLMTSYAYISLQAVGSYQPALQAGLDAGRRPSLRPCCLREPPRARGGWWCHLAGRDRSGKLAGYADVASSRRTNRNRRDPRLTDRLAFRSLLELLLNANLWVRRQPGQPWWRAKENGGARAELKGGVAEQVSPQALL